MVWVHAFIYKAFTKELGAYFPCKGGIALTLRSLWNDVRPNLIWLTLTTIPVAAWTGSAIVTHGLKWWQQAILVTIVGLLCLWASIATYLATRTKLPIPPPLAHIPTTQSLRERVFAICSELSDYAKGRGDRPDEDKLWNETHDNKQEFVHRYENEIQRWDDKLSAGYWLYFREKLVDLRHELVLNDCRDEQLGIALSELDLQPTRTYLAAIRTAVERFRYLAATLQ